MRRSNTNTHKLIEVYNYNVPVIAIRRKISYIPEYEYAFFVHQNSFLRLNNRKKRQSIKDFNEAGYPVLTIAHTVIQRFEYYSWCNDVFKKGSWGTNGLGSFVFRNEHDATLFKLTWV